VCLTNSIYASRTICHTLRRNVGRRTSGRYICGHTIITRVETLSLHFVTLVDTLLSHLHTTLCHPCRHTMVTLMNTLMSHLSHLWKQYRHTCRHTLVALARPTAVPLTDTLSLTHYHYTSSTIITLQDTLSSHLKTHLKTHTLEDTSEDTHTCGHTHLWIHYRHT